MGAEGGRVRVEPTAKRIRAQSGGQTVVDTHRALLVWETPYYPVYYLPAADLRTELINPDAVTYPGGDDRLREHVRLDWAAMDAWFEEDEEVFVHPRDPGVRIDVLASSRRVRIEADGVVVADSSAPRLLFETNLPVRYYLPKLDVRMELLEPSDTVTHCPYKGSARYWSLRIGDQLYPDLAWSYPTPVPESAKIAGLIAIPQERVQLYVDGQQAG
ncbi:uncharacterized protein (DUF427 family) [Tamaricihabitans halophyticus]|uniref:Uncharacterized protein (DUF427 family) n=1 Tax=Tamaricihabitans halophyticus TaxID=1262583 RepID=A0A4R2Q840_9PSEU|nr:DUF427 domain-containing protein [Tamaricihabitans halophyticus]TCP45123.1 uncharacterized protein (DUF427 family) [Tamaricihabitans halophyticus]